MKQKLIKNILCDYVLVCLLFVLCSLIFNRWVECAAFCVAHCLYRYKFRYTMKCNYHILEVFLFLIWCIVPHTISGAYTTLSIVFDGFVICWVGWSIQEQIFLAIETKAAKKRKAEEFNVETCSKEELIIRCKTLKLSSSQTELAIAFFIDKTKQSILADKLCVEEKTIAQQKYRLKQRLNTHSEEPHKDDKVTS